MVKANIFPLGSAFLRTRTYSVPCDYLLAFLTHPNDMDYGQYVTPPLRWTFSQRRVSLLKGGKEGADIWLPFLPTIPSLVNVCNAPALHVISFILHHDVPHVSLALCLGRHFSGTGRFRAEVPSGASTGIYEAVELRDGGSAYVGKGESLRLSPRFCASAQGRLVC